MIGFMIARHEEHGAELFEQLDQEGEAFVLV